METNLTITFSSRPRVNFVYSIKGFGSILTMSVVYVGLACCFWEWVSYHIPKMQGLLDYLAIVYAPSA